MIETEDPDSDVFASGPGFYPVNIGGNPDAPEGSDGILIRMCLDPEGLASFRDSFAVFGEHHPADEKPVESPIDLLTFSSITLEELQDDPSKATDDFSIPLNLWATETGIAFIWYCYPVLINFAQPPADVEAGVQAPEMFGDPKEAESWIDDSRIWHEFGSQLNARNLRIGLPQPAVDEMGGYWSSEEAILRSGVRPKVAKPPSKNKGGRPKKEVVAKREFVNEPIKYFKVTNSALDMGVAQTHAGQERGIPTEGENGHQVMILTPATSKGLSSANKQPYTSAYQLPLFLDERSGLREYVIRHLGPGSLRYLMVMEAIYQFRDSKDGTLYCTWPDLMDAFSMKDRTENRQRVRDFLLAAANLRVYSETVETKEVANLRVGQKRREKIRRFDFEPFLTVSPWSRADGSELSSRDALVKASAGELETFTGVGIKLTRYHELQSSFFYVPKLALNLRAGGELNALNIGLRLLSDMYDDWGKYGGIWRQGIFPQYPHGSHGDYRKMERQGLLHRAGLSTEKPERVLDRLPDWMETARQHDLVGNVLIEGEGVATTMEATAPLWFWHVMQGHSQRKYKKATPDYVQELIRRELRLEAKRKPEI